MIAQAELHAEQRRLALLAVAWMLAVAVIGATDALGYLAPTLTILALLVLGRYPGERAYARRIARRVAPRKRRLPPAPRGRRVSIAPPRGGALIAARLGGRAPPLLAG